MSATYWLPRIAPSLRRQGLGDCEVFCKEGKSRRLEVGPQGLVSSRAEESGWAVRASGSRTSLFACGTDEPLADGPWPEPDGFPVPLPPALAGDEWSQPPDLDAPLMVEGEAIELLDACGSEFERELPGGRLLRAVLEDGESRSEIASSSGIEAAFRSRSATLLLEAVAPGSTACKVIEFAAERDGRYFNPRLLARRLADRLVIRERGGGVEKDRAPCLLAPPVVLRLLEGLLPLLIGPGAASMSRQRADRQGRVASERLTVIDDARLNRGLFSAGVDGEGVPTRTLTLIEKGVFRQPLVGWWQAAPYSARPAGCARRMSWRQPPRVGPSHLYIQPDRSVSVHGLLSSMSRGYYFIDVLRGGKVDLASDRLRLPVAGFRVRDGRAEAPVARALVQGRISTLLHRVQGVARDLMFSQSSGVLGAPSLLITGLEIVGD